jgi:predicted esterase
VGLSDTVKIVSELVEAEIKAGTPTSKIVLGGFSQGAATSLHFAYGGSYPHRLAGIAALSGYLPFYKEIVKVCSSFIPRASEDPGVIKK